MCDEINEERYCASGLVCHRCVDSANTDSAFRVKAPLEQQATEFIAGNWRWVGALVLLAAVVSIWAWRNYFSPYDKAGLPRGPRL